MSKMFALALVYLLATAAHAQVVRVGVLGSNGEVNVSDHAAGSDVTLDLSTLIAAAQNANVERMRVWDPSRPGDVPNDGVGRLTIRVDVTAAQSGRVLDRELRVLVTPSGDFLNNPVDPFPQTDFALTSMRSLTIIPADANNVEQVELADALRKVTRLTAAVTGDIGLAGANDQIDIGQIYRVQCGGVIHADLTTRMENAASPQFSVAPGFDSMMYVVTGQGVTGDILVKGSMNDAVLGSNGNYDAANGRLRTRLDSLIIGPAATVGLQGNVTVEEGYIRRIFTTAPIGQADTPVEIKAGRGVFEVVARSETAPVYLNVPFHLNIDAAVSDELATEMGGGLTSTRNGAVHRVRTASNYTGNIDARNLYPPSGCFKEEIPRNGSGPDFGIIVGGSMTGSIHIDDTMCSTSIIAQTFTGPVKVGLTMSGTIRAASPTGQIPEVSIGERAPDRSEFGINAPKLQYYGMLGSLSVPVPRDESAYALTHGAVPGGWSVDSVVRAAVVNRLYVRGMSRGSGYYRPRIEVATVHDLIIGVPYTQNELTGNTGIIGSGGGYGTMLSGVAWSGLLESPVNDRTNDYVAVTGTTSVFGAASTSDLWLSPVDVTLPREISLDRVASAPGGYPDYELPQRVFGGRLHVPEVVPQLTITAEGLGVRTGSVWSNAGGQPVADFVEDSPRQYRLADVTAWNSEAGSIRIAATQGLAGQIIIDRSRVVPPVGQGDEQDPFRWDGTVVVGGLDASGNPTPASIQLSATASRASAPEFEGPAYSALPSTFGGGAVGLVPFGVHEASSNAINAGRTLLTSTLGDTPCDDVWAAIDFYGPVELELNPLAFPPSRTTLKVGSADLSNISSLVRHRRNGHVGAARRMLEVRGRSGAVLPPATDAVLMGLRYEAASDTSLSDPLRCDFSNLTQGEGPLVKTFAYRFEVGFDRVPDRLCPNATAACVQDDPLVCGYELPAAFCDSIDFNNNDVYPEDPDVIDFFAVLSGLECPTCNDIDFNNNGVFPEDEDVIAFFRVLAGGNCVMN